MRWHDNPTDNAHRPLPKPAFTIHGAMRHRPSTATRGAQLYCGHCGEHAPKPLTGSWRCVCRESWIEPSETRPSRTVDATELPPCPYCDRPMHPASESRYGACSDDHGEILAARREADELRRDVERQGARVEQMRADNERLRKVIAGAVEPIGDWCCGECGRMLTESHGDDCYCEDRSDGTECPPCDICAPSRAALRALDAALAPTKPETEEPTDD